MTEPHDTELTAMLYADGELPHGELPADDNYLKGVIEDTGYLGELVRTLVEVESDESMNQSAAWSSIKKEIVAKPETSPSSRGMFARLARWLKGPPGYMLSAAAAAAAVALIFMLRQPREEGQQALASSSSSAVSKVLASSASSSVIRTKSEPTEVQNLEVNEGSGAIIGIVDEYGETTMIWIDDSEENEL